MLSFCQTVLELQLLLKEKLNLAAHDMFLKTTDLADAETGNLQHTVGNDVITLCTWGNLSKNTRYTIYGKYMVEKLEKLPLVKNYC